MTADNLPSINNKADFLAHAGLMIQESLDQYKQLADSMEMHNNPEAAIQFRKLEYMEEQQLHWIEKQAIDMTLPDIAPWDFTWHCHNDPAKSCLSDMDYLVNPAQALSAALHNEYHSEKFYRKIANQASDSAVKQLAGELASQQLQQIELLEQRLQSLLKEAFELIDDMDPPNMPE